MRAKSMPACATIAVIGAGIAGLRAAERLERNGCSVFILESKPIAGGRMDTAYQSDGVASHERGAWRVRGARAERLIRRYNGTLRPIRDRPKQERAMSDERAMVRAQGTLRDSTMTKSRRTRNLSARDVFLLSGSPTSRGDKGYHGLDDRAVGTRTYSTGAVTTPLLSPQNQRKHYKVLKEVLPSCDSS